MGQNPSAERLLSTSEANVSLALPAVCVMEAISAFDWKRIERNRLKDELDRQLSQLQRSTDLQTALRLATELTQADLTNAQLLSELFQRLDDYLVRIASRQNSFRCQLRLFSTTFKWHAKPNWIATMR